MTSFSGRSQFVIRQRIRPMVNQYEVFALAEDGQSEGELLAFVEQKRMALKEDLRFYSSPDKSQELWRIKARKLMDLASRYDVTDAQGNRIGVIGKEFGRSLLRSTWRVYNGSEQEIGWAQEKSMPVALFRRFAGSVSSLLEMIPLPYHFLIYSGQQEVGSLTRAWGLRDRYLLDLGQDSGETLDRRLMVALAVGLDALQAR